MKLSDFIRNNKNYGKEISDDDLPPEYLEGIYRYARGISFEMHKSTPKPTHLLSCSAIKENQIRTLGEGADGSMTSERWKQEHLANLTIEWGNPVLFSTKFGEMPSGFTF